MTRFAHLFSPVQIGPVTVHNRIVSTGHHTHLADGVPSAELIAYHTARAQGGAGLIVSEIVSVHPSGHLFSSLLRAEAAHLGAFAALVEPVKATGTRLFAQLFHPGREVMFADDGMGAVAYAPSAVPTERFHVMPRALPEAMIEDIVDAHGAAAALMARAGFDGVEIVGSHGYLPAQFLSPQVNQRTDAWGGSAERRLHFVQRVVAAIRAAAPTLAVGLRLSGDELDGHGLGSEDTLGIARGLAPVLDYLSVTAGTSASLGGAVHITPPMGLEPAYTAPLAAAIRAAVDVPVIVTGRINQPQVAEALIADGAADLCGMTRALITDPEMPNKARAGDTEAIRACIGCNQSCIGRAHKDLGVSCIQRPESGRETRFGVPPPAANPKHVIVVGGGPGGLKAAGVCAARGHRTELWEAASVLGGQALLAGKLPGRSDFGGLVDNLHRDLPAAVQVHTGCTATAETLRTAAPDAVVIATGARPYVPALAFSDDAPVLTAWQVLEGAATGGRVVVADWRADWVGIGIAEHLAAAGASVRLRVNAAMPGELLQAYTRNHGLARLYALGVDMQPHLRLFGADADTVYFQNVLTGEAVVEDGCDTLVLALGHQPHDPLVGELQGAPFAVHTVGDARAARTAEEAIYEGMTCAWAL
ncbi:MAG: FAD-dependent oxidoreductase [Pseudomonadota bacterium]